MSKVEVTQTDREAAAQLADQIQEWDIAKNIREGKRDPYVWCQAFARHREQAAAEERAKIVAWLREQAGPKEMLLFNETAWVLADCIEADEHKTFTRSSDT